MIKRTIKETVNEYDKDGRLVRQTITETSEDDDTQYYPYPYYPYTYQEIPPVCQNDGSVARRVLTSELK